MVESRHAEGADGNPVVNADGHFRVRRGGPVEGAVVETVETNEPEDNTEEVVETAPSNEFEEGADDQVPPEGSSFDNWSEGLE